MATIIPDTSNVFFKIATELVNQSSRNIFLTGKAGTGKTTFLKYIKETCPKQMAIVAPTGVAAINAGGVTIHSFFQLPISPFVPVTKVFTPGRKAEETVNRHSLLGRLRMTNEKKKVLRELELLIIDEISMVRCDTLDAIDTVLRHIRHRPHEMFGGVQVLFIGDMFQLPPVVPGEEWKILTEFYNSPFFFDSKVIQEHPPLYIEFQTIYRQSDEQFILLLNQVRNNEIDDKGKDILLSCYKPSFEPTKDDGYIILTTHNNKAETINNNELKKLDTALVSFKAEIEGEFSEKSYPAEEILNMKSGAQVMFIKNDIEKNKRYYNGRIGIITRIDGEKIFVKCKDEPSDIEVKKETWKNIRYTLNKNTKLLEEEELGSFTQYPLRLAWAITIHKSQGLTFEKAIIDAGEAFAPGQVYVALSRCTNLDGMILKSKIRANTLCTDGRIVAFSQKSSSTSHLQSELAEAQKKYFQFVLLSAFDFGAIIKNCQELDNYVKEHSTSFNDETLEWLIQLNLKLQLQQETGKKFQGQLLQILKEPDTSHKNEKLKERVGAAAVYFCNELQQLSGFLKASPAITDSWIHAREYNDNLKEIFDQTALKTHLLAGCKEEFNIELWHQRKKTFLSPSFFVNAYAGAAGNKAKTAHPELYQQLKKQRDSICARKDLPIYIVAGSKTLDEMAEYLPQTMEELEQISGFGKAKLELYGKEFLEIIRQYCDQHGLSSSIKKKIPKRKRNEIKTARIDTKAESYRLYKEGKTVTEIAAVRSFTTQTIEGHLAYYVQQGKIAIEELISREKLMLIEPELQNLESGSINLIKQRLGENISFGEIRLAIAGREYLKSKVV